MPTSRPLGEPASLAAPPDRRSATILDLTRRLPPVAAELPATDESLLKLAAWTEATFKSYGLTLTDESTARAHLATLDIVATLLKGAARLGKVDEDAHGYLSDVLDDSRNVTDVI